MKAPNSTSPRAIAEWVACSVGVSDVLLDQLYSGHVRQWTLEDESRDPAASAEQVSEAKRTIDALNACRHRLIDAIDASVSCLLLDAEPRYYSETVGEFCDRLLILDLKQRALDGQDAERIRLACEHLCLAARQLVADARKGRAALPPRFGMKIYNVAATSEDGRRE